MYPNLYFFLQDVFGITPPGFTLYINSFGFLVAIAFVVAAMFLKNELKRKEDEGLLFSLEEKMKFTNDEILTITQLLNKILKNDLHT